MVWHISIIEILLKTQKQCLNKWRHYRSNNLKSIVKMRHSVFGGCPKRKVCSFRQINSKTCIYGPYKYCGKYRLIAQSDRRTKVAWQKSNSFTILPLPIPRLQFLSIHLPRLISCLFSPHNKPQTNFPRKP
jgi:hypothetical protein